MLALMAKATGTPMRFASIVFGAVADDHDVDVQLVRTGCSYVAALTVTSGEAVRAEHVLPIRWTDLDETTRLTLIGIYLDAILEAHARWRRRVLQGLAVRPAND